MMRTLRFLAIFIAGLFATTSIWAQETIRFARTPDISPDGRSVVFSYLGDLWLVSVEGGLARHLTMHEKTDSHPVFSPDGSQIAFASNRFGSTDVFVIPTRGGRPTRLTFDSADEIPTGWSPDGKRVLFQSNRLVDFPVRDEMFSVPATSGRIERLSAFEGRDGVLSPKGDWLLYTRGYKLGFRKGYRGSSNDDLWLCAADGSHNRQLTDFNGTDSSPMWAADGAAIFYVSERFGTPANIVRQEISPADSGLPRKPPQPVTDHKDESVRRARINTRGDTIVYECGTDLWIHSLSDRRSRKLAIEVYADDKSNAEKTLTFSSNASEYALTPDEKAICFVVHGEIFMVPRNGGKAKRLTNDPAFDHGMVWSPDGKKMLFLSDREGQEDIYALESEDAEHPDLAKSHRFKAKRLTNSPDRETMITFSPDGKRATFLRDGKLVTMNPAGGEEKILREDGRIFDYEWSPDGNWIAYAREDGSFSSEIFIMPAAGATPENPARNVTRYATFNRGITWSRTNQKLAFLSARRGTETAFVMSLQKPAALGIGSNAEIDWPDIHLRVKQPTPMAITECAISGDGSRIAFRANVDGDDLWIANSDGGQVTRITTGGVKPSEIRWSKYFPSLLYFRDGNGALRTVTLGNPNQLGTIGFTARMVVKQEELFTEMFDQSWRALNESFYDVQFHGVNWKAMREKYRPLVRHCASREDLYYLVNMMIGELNASHLGIFGPPAPVEGQTAELGLIYDPFYKGPGEKVVEVVRGGPGDRRGIFIKPGEIIVSVDGTPLSEKTDLSQLLNDRSGEVVALEVSTNPDDARNRRRVELVPISRKAMAELMYERWIRTNAERVAKLSEGKLGYIHIPSMDDPGLERFVRALYSDNFDKNGIVLDVRYNGGGFTHEKVLTYLAGREHTIFHHRHGAFGLVLRSDDRRWTKPLVLLVNNRSFSDAEILPHGFRTLGLGKLVGQTTGGFVIGTRNIKLIDGSEFRTPRTGVFTHTGINMEKAGVPVDVEILNHPDQTSVGEDTQLRKAVDVLTQDVEAWQKTRRPSGAPANPAASGGGSN